MRRFPPLHTLRIFEAVGRHLSFSKAAQELALTQSAVSHQIRALENDLGVALFIRKTRAIELTPPGQRYWHSMQQIFDLLASSTNAIRQEKKTLLRVSLLSSFATNWLIPRLRSFTDAHPEIEVQIEPGFGFANLSAGQADVAIRYGLGGWHDVDSQLLLAERLSPVCSPDLLAHGPALAEAADLLHHTLLMANVRQPFEWDAWSDAVGIDLARARKNALRDYNIVLQAAADGQGVAMGRLILIEKQLQTGTLVQPLPQVVSGKVGHYIATAPGLQARHIQVFIDWLLAQAAAGNASPRF